MSRQPDPTIRAVPAVTRAVAILRLLARSTEPLGINPIARELGIVPSTCLHILRALAAEGLVAVEPVTKRYVIDAGVLTLARSALQRDDVASHAQPELDGLASRFPVTAICVRVIGLKHMIVVAISRSDTALRLRIDIGSRFPALISATGRCLAAFGGHPADKIELGFRALRWESAPSFAVWQADVAETRRRGYGIDKGTYIRGVTIFAAPVVGADDSMTHALAAVGLTDQVSAHKPSVVGGEMKTAAQRLSARLG